MPLEIPAKKLGTCRACPQQIFWAQSPAGNDIPMDIRTVAELLSTGVAVSTIQYRADNHEGQYVVLFRATDDEAPADERYVSHFTTCPQAGQFKRSRR